MTKINALYKVLYNGEERKKMTKFAMVMNMHKEWGRHSVSLYVKRNSYSDIAHEYIEHLYKKYLYSYTHRHYDWEYAS